MSSKMPKYIPHVPIPPLDLSSQKPEHSQSKNNLFTEQETFMRKLWQLVSKLSSCKLCFISPSSQTLNVNQTKLYKL